jgi:hypothetical protein
VRAWRKAALSTASIGLLGGLIACYYLIRTCGTTQGRAGLILIIGVCPLLATVIVALLRFMPTLVWLLLLVAAPVGTFILAFIVGLAGDSAGYCGGY